MPHDFKRVLDFVVFDAFRDIAIKETQRNGEVVPQQIIEGLGFSETRTSMAALMSFSLMRLIKVAICGS